MKTERTEKRGIALIVVLGLLALLLMMAVAFSIFMRTERHASGGFQHDVRARLLLQAAASKALEALDANLADRYYPDWVVLYSTGGSATNSLSTQQPWAAHIPGSLLADPALTNALNRVSWLSVPGGRVGYLIVNASGLLDVNRTGGGARGLGLDPAEIDLTALGEVVNVGDLIAGRDFESVRELKKGAPGNGLSLANHFVTYSRSPTNDVSPVPLDISGDAARLEGIQADILRVLNTKVNSVSVFLDIIPATALEALLDYVDTNSVPRNLNSPTTERVPMFNEIYVIPKLYRIIGNPLASRLSFIASVELINPFVKPPDDGPYSIDYSVTVVPSSGSPAGIPSPGTVTGSRANVWPVGSPICLDVPLKEPLAEFVITNSVYAGLLVQFDATFNYLRLRNKDGDEVDRVEGLPLHHPPSSSANKPSIVIPASPPAGFRPVDGTRGGRECIDPRYNHMTPKGPLYAGPWMRYDEVTNRTKKVIGTSGTLGLENDIAVHWCTNTALYKNDGHRFMHVADAPLQSVGELSYIIRGMTGNDKMWSTLRLFPVQELAADPIYDYFAVSSATNTVRGFVNPNTDVPAVMEAVFRGMPLDAYPGEPGAPTVSAAQARQLALAWMSDPGWDAGYVSRQAMVGNTNYVNALSALVSSMTHKEFRREAGIRNLLGLLNPRQNYFLIALFAQSSSQVRLPRPGDAEGSLIDTVRSDSSALLEVWRDPRAVGTGTGVTNRPLFIRRFEVLAEE